MTELIDFLDAGRKQALRELAAKVEASDDTAMTAWLAWQELVKLPDADRTKAVGLVLAMEEIHRLANGRPPLFAGRVR